MNAQESTAERQTCCVRRMLMMNPDWTGLTTTTYQHHNDSDLQHRSVRPSPLHDAGVICTGLPVLSLQLLRRSPLTDTRNVHKIKLFCTQGPVTLVQVPITSLTLILIREGLDRLPHIHMVIIFCVLTFFRLLLPLVLNMFGLQNAMRIDGTTRSKNPI